MKILRVIQTLDPAYGGPVHGLMNSAAEHARMGHETEAITLDAPDAPYLADVPFPVHGCGPMRTFVRYRYAPGIGRWIAANAHRFDGAVMHGLWDHAAIAGGLALRRSDLKYLVFTHGMIDPWFRRTSPLKHQVKQAIWTFALGKVLAGAHRVLFTSKQERTLAEPEFRGPGYRAHVVPYGTVDVPDSPEIRARDEAALRAAIPSLGEAPYLLFLGRIHVKKGLDLLIEAFLEKAAAMPDLHLVIAGPDQEGIADGLRAQAEAAGLGARIHWPGMLRGEAKIGALRGADAFVLVSHSENFGIAVAEALACGTPVLISDKVNIWEEIQQDGAGLIAGDTAEGARELLTRWAAMDAGARADMRAAALACHGRHFSMPAAAQGLIDAFE